MYGRAASTARSGTRSAAAAPRAGQGRRRRRSPRHGRASRGRAPPPSLAPRRGPRPGAARIPRPACCRRHEVTDARGQAAQFRRIHRNGQVKRQNRRLRGVHPGELVGLSPAGHHAPPPDATCRPACDAVTADARAEIPVPRDLRPAGRLDSANLESISHPRLACEAHQPFPAGELVRSRARSKASRSSSVVTSPVTRRSSTTTASNWPRSGGRLSSELAGEPGRRGRPTAPAWRFARAASWRGPRPGRAPGPRQRRPRQGRRPS